MQVTYQKVSDRITNQIVFIFYWPLSYEKFTGIRPPYFPHWFGVAAAQQFGNKKNSDINKEKEWTDVKC